MYGQADPKSESETQASHRSQLLDPRSQPQIPDPSSQILARQPQIPARPPIPSQTTDFLGKTPVWRQTPVNTHFVRVLDGIPRNWSFGHLGYHRRSVRTHNEINGKKPPAFHQKNAPDLRTKSIFTSFSTKNVISARDAIFPTFSVSEISKSATAQNPVPRAPKNPKIPKIWEKCKKVKFRKKKGRKSVRNLRKTRKTCCETPDRPQKNREKEIPG